MAQLNVPFHILLEELDFSGGERWYFLKRFRREGITFTTKILPVLWKGTLACIENRRFDPRFFMFAGGFPFNWKEPSLRKLRLDILELANGSKEPYVLYRLSQLCQYTYKLALPFTNEQLKDASDTFVATNTQVGELEVDPDYLDGLRKWIETKFRSLTQYTVDDVIVHARDGSGNVSGTPLGVSPRAHKDCLEATSPAAFNAFKGVFRSRSTDVSTGLPLPIRVKDSYVFEPTTIAFVPKDSRGPRTIGMEDPYLIKLQMGFHDFVKPHLESVTRGRIQFTDQYIMQELARVASISKEKSTLDLKEASDRHAYRVASHLYRNFPFVHYALTRFRSRNIRLQGQAKVHQEGRTTLISLNCVSGMGSGLTFPLMAWSIYSTICYYVKRYRGIDITSLVYVYGDDVVVPTPHYTDAVDALEKIGFVINKTKSFYKGGFRESCGGDYYFGNIVTPERLKLTFSKVTCKGTTITLDEQAIIKLERHCRRLVLAGLRKLADYYYTAIESWLGGPLPKSASDKVPYLIRLDRFHSYTPDHTGHYGYVKGYTVSPVNVKTIRPGLNRSLKSHLTSMTGVSWEDQLFPEGCSLFGIDASRYRIKLTPVTIPAIELLSQ